MRHTHIYRGTHTWSEPEYYFDPSTGEADGYQREYEAAEAFCGLTEMEESLEFAILPEDASCPECVSEYALYELGSL